MHWEIITPDTKIYEGEVNLVQLPGIDGFFEILNNHAPLISILSKGRVKVIDTSESTKNFNINGGAVEVLKNNIIILAE